MGQGINENPPNFRYEKALNFWVPWQTHSVLSLRPHRSSGKDWGPETCPGECKYLPRRSCKYFRSKPYRTLVWKDMQNPKVYSLLSEVLNSPLCFSLTLSCSLPHPKPPKPEKQNKPSFHRGDHSRIEQEARAVSSVTFSARLTITWLFSSIP